MQKKVPPLSLVLAVFAVLGSISLFSFVEVNAAASADSFAAVVLPPWWSEQSTFAAAIDAGPVIGMGGLPFVVLVPNRPGEKTRLRGEWLRLHIPTSLSCLSGVSSDDRRS